MEIQRFGLISPFKMSSKVWTALLLLCSCLLVVQALNCYNCNTLKGFKDYHADCRKNPAKGRAPLTYGSKACVRAEVRYRGNSEIVRFGLNATQLPSTPNQRFPMACDPTMVKVSLGGITLNSYTSCDICNDVDLCNSGHSLRSKSQSQLLPFLSACAVLLLFFVQNAKV